MNSIFPRRSAYRYFSRTLQTALLAFLLSALAPSVVAQEAKDQGGQPNQPAVSNSAGLSAPAKGGYQPFDAR